MQRRISTFVNPFIGQIPKGHYQNAVYAHGEKFPPGLAGGRPAWYPCDFTLAPNDTQDTTISIDEGFQLLAFLASSALGSGLGDGFRVQLYDVQKGIKFVDRGINFENVGGLGGAPYFQRSAYPFDEANPQVFVRVINLQALQNAVQVVLFGVVVPQ